MLEPVLLKETTQEEAHELLYNIEKEYKSMSITAAQWKIVGPLLAQAIKACHRRSRGDA